MPFKLRLWKKSQKYNVQMVSASSFPRVSNALSQPNLHHPIINSDPIYANAHAASLSLMEALQDSYVTTVRPFSPSATSFEGHHQQQMLPESQVPYEERLKFLPSYREPPDYDSYIKRKYVVHGTGSLPFLPVSHIEPLEDARFHFSSMQHHLNQVPHHQASPHHSNHIHANFPHHHLPHHVCCGAGSDTL